MRHPGNEKLIQLVATRTKVMAFTQPRIRHDLIGDLAGPPSAIGLSSESTFDTCVRGTRLLVPIVGFQGVQVRLMAGSRVCALGHC